MDRIINLILAGYEAELKRRDKNEDRMYPATFQIEILAGKLVGPTRRRFEHHKARESHYQEQLNEAEKELREKGVSIEVTEDPQRPGTYNICVSGSMGGQQSLAGSENAKLQAVLDPKLLEAVKKAKGKVIHHLKEKTFFENQLRAFRLAPPDLKLTLTTTDIDRYKLEPEDVQ